MLRAAVRANVRSRALAPGMPRRRPMGSAAAAAPDVRPVPAPVRSGQWSFRPTGATIPWRVCAEFCPWAFPFWSLTPVALP